MTDSADTLRVYERGQCKLLQPVDIEAFRAHNRTKPKALVDKVMDEKEAISRFFEDGRNHLRREDSFAGWRIVGL